MMKILLLLCACSLALVDADPQTLQCNSKISTDKCSDLTSQQCQVKAGSKVDVFVQFTPDSDAEKATSTAELRVGQLRGDVRKGISTVWLDDEDACSGGLLDPGCPVKSGQQYTLTRTIEIPNDSGSDFLAEMSLKDTDSGKFVMCAVGYFHIE